MWAHVAIGVIDIANDVLPIYSSGLVDGRLNDPASGLIPGLDEAECMFEEFYSITVTCRNKMTSRSDC